MKLLTDLLYLTALALLVPVILVAGLLPGRRNPALSGRGGSGPALTGDPRPTVLLHGVSVGEVEALSSVVAALSEGGRVRPVISATTSTGLDAAARVFGDAAPIERFPLDFSWCVRRFLDRIDPDLVVLTELEVWPNFVRECRRRGTPVAVVNGRISARNARVSRFAGPLLSGAFGALTRVFAQSEEYAGRFRALGTPGDRIQVMDALKWDGTPGASGRQEPDEALADALGVDLSRPVVLAISTGPGEEELLSRSLPRGVQLILAPRRPERFEEVAAAHPGAPRRSLHPDGADPAASEGDVFLLDTLGEIARALTIADFAVMGRSLAGGGGSNPIQSVGAGIPTVIGPEHENFREIVEVLRAAGGILVSDDPMGEVERLVGDPAAAEELARRGVRAVEQRRGAGRRTADALEDLLRDRAVTWPGGHLAGSDPA